jgi:hypothetical protein
MRQIIKIIILLLLPTIGFAEPVESLKGFWKSPFGAIYKSDGTDFVCIELPDNLKAKYGHWLNKNKLTDIVSTESGIEATEFLRWKDGRIQKIPSNIVLDGNSLIFIYFDKENRYIQRRIYERIDRHLGSV